MITVSTAFKGIYLDANMHSCICSSWGLFVYIHIHCTSEFVEELVSYQTDARRYTSKQVKQLSNVGL